MFYNHKDNLDFPDFPKWNFNDNQKYEQFGFDLEKYINKSKEKENGKNDNISPIMSTSIE